MSKLLTGEGKGYPLRLLTPTTVDHQGGGAFGTVRGRSGAFASTSTGQNVWAQNNALPIDKALDWKRCDLY